MGLIGFSPRTYPAISAFLTDHAFLTNTLPEFTIYLKLLGAALSGRTPKETYEEQLEDIKSLNNKKIMRVSGNRTKGLGILHRDQLNLINQRLKHRLVFDEYFKEIDVLITPVASSSAFKHNQNGPRHRRFLPQ